MASGMTVPYSHVIWPRLGFNNKTAATFLEHLADTAIERRRRTVYSLCPASAAS